MLIDSEIWKPLVTLFTTNYAFSFSFIVYLMSIDVFILNIKKEYRYSQVYLGISLCLAYSILYQFGTIRWFILGLNTDIPEFDESYWIYLEFFTQVIHLVFLCVLKRIMKSYKQDCEGDG